MSKKLKPWERREGEGPERWEAFTVFRDMGLSRTIQGLSDKLSKSRQLFTMWSGEDGWRERVEAWDREQDRIRLEAQSKALSKVVTKEFTDREQTRDWLFSRWKHIADIALKDPVHDEEGNVIATKPNFFGALRSTELIAKATGILQEKQDPNQTNNYATFIQIIKGLPDEEGQPIIEIEKD